MMLKGKIVGLIILGVFIVVYLFWSIYHNDPAISSEIYATASTSVEVKKEVKEAVPIKSIRVFTPKSRTVKKLDLPEDVANDDRQQIISAVDVPPTRHGATSVTLIDTTTGEARTLIKAKPRPLFCWSRETEVGALGGISTHGDVAILYVRREIAQIGPANLAIMGGAGTIGGALGAGGMININARW